MEFIIVIFSVLWLWGYFTFGYSSNTSADCQKEGASGNDILLHAANAGVMLVSKQLQAWCACMCMRLNQDSSEEALRWNCWEFLPEARDVSHV